MRSRYCSPPDDNVRLKIAVKQKDHDQADMARAHALQERVAAETQAHQNSVAAATKHDAAQRRVPTYTAWATAQLGSDKAIVRLAGLYARPRTRRICPPEHVGFGPSPVAPSGWLGPGTARRSHWLDRSRSVGGVWLGGQQYLGPATGVDDGGAGEVVGGAVVGDGVDVAKQ